MSLPNNDPLRVFPPPVSLSLLFYTSALSAHNRALLASEGGNQGEKAPALWNTLRERGLLFLHSGWPFGSTRPSSLPPWLAGALSAPPPAVGLPGNGGLERSVQGLSDSGCRLADDLLAGLESSEPRQLKWSLKLEPTFREGGKKTGGRRESALRAPAWRHAGRLGK